MEITSIQALRPDSDYDTLVSNAITEEPDYIILATTPQDTAEIKNRLDQTGSRAKLFLTDLSGFDSLIETLGEKAEGLELIGPSTDPKSGFDEAYLEKFKQDPPNMMASTYDAFMLTAATLTRQEYAHRYSILPFSIKENTAESLRNVLFGDIGGKVFGWNQLDQMLDDIASGNIPTIDPLATGIVAYDKDSGVDPVGTFYAYSRVENGKFTIQQLISADSGRAVSAAGTVGSIRQTNFEATTTHTLPEKKDLQAVIAATSDEWQNYRHQSDAFAMYQLFKSQGLSDDKIHLLVVDDVANYAKNNPKPSLFHVKDGSDNYANPAIDLSGEKVTVDNFRQTLLSLNSDKNTNLLIYIAGHGGTGSTATDSSSQLGDEGMIRFSHGNPLASHELKAVIEEMAAKKKFRQMLVVLETCFSGAMGKDITTPNVLFLSAASDQEVSYGANYSSKIRQWLADQFTYQFIKHVQADPDLTIADLYNKVYGSVPGSHVTLQNYKNFPNLIKTPISDFIKP
ncbi:MAG TPA: C13 family peptidase, partial [bacterium]|nr:C13 family peptidase [bacterium]